MLPVVWRGNEACSVTLKKYVSDIVSERNEGMSGTKTQKEAERRGHMMRRFIIFVIYHHHRHHHHHVQEGVNLIPVPCILKMKLVPPSLPRSSYVSSSF